jgi:hypothetical protein
LTRSNEFFVPKFYQLWKQEKQYDGGKGEFLNLYYVKMNVSHFIE